MADFAHVENFGGQVVAFYPKIQIRNSALLIYETSDPPPQIHNRHDFSTSATYSGTVTTHAQRRIKQALDILLQISPTRHIFNPVSNSTHDFRLNFITLTVTDQKNITARQAYDILLREWLRYFKTKTGLRSYLWKAELQEREQIHYHVATNCFIPWQTIRWRWNSLQKKAGLLDSFAKKFKHFNPNSTDVHTIQKVSDVEAYISKYLSKTSQNLKRTDGKVWDASTNLKTKRFSTDLDRETWENIKDGLNSGLIQEIETDHCKIYHLAEPKRALSKATAKAYRNFLQTCV